MLGRHPRVLVNVILVSAVSAAGLFMACTDSYRTGAASGSGTGGAGNSGSGSGGTGGGLINDGGVCELSCSNDLKKVINCKGVTVEDCLANGQVCVNSACTDDPPCTAAEIAKSSYGCEFWAVKTALSASANGACFAAFIANTWNQPLKIEVERNGMALPVANFTRIPVVQGQTVTYDPYDAVNGLPVGQVAILFLSRNPFGGPVAPACPVAPAIANETGALGTGRGEAFRIRTDFPAVGYQLVPYGGGDTNVTGATLLIPTSAWDINYMAINGFSSSAPFGDPSLTIVAKEDTTVVTINPRVDIIGNMMQGVEPAMAGVPKTYTLQAGEFLQITQPEELTGSAIQSDKPIGVWGAHTCMTVPANVYDCDSSQQQLAPVRALGHEYAAAPYVARGANDTPVWRIIGAVDGTELTWDPAAPAGAPEALELGQVVEFSTAEPFAVRSQDNKHPFYLAQYMTGGEPYAGTTAGFGDPEWVTVVPPSQYLNYYAFFADPTYPETSLAVIRTRSKVDGTFADVHLDCTGPLTEWQPFGDYEYAHVPLVTGDFQQVGNCTNGRHEMWSDLPFGVVVWGWGTTQQTSLVSYAYPAGAGFQPINDVVIDPSQ